MLIPGWLLQHTITVEAWLGEGPTGPRFAAPAEVRCFVDEQTRLVRSPNDDEVTSSSTAYCRPDTECPAKSRVRLPTGRTTTVIAALRRDGGRLPTPDHLEVQMR
ncbi:hypothetical protein DMB38_12765 [Streptomyces sp. WAC 06738]|uniref:hypothetical protein n=1 Tax=Streptomyces sp. WAC 06738 TaxID=2203210 RepID=UPI000F6E55B8|nr:hypothetical protein [Streptomyces sp. WAC 06738]AZM46568.1 hypothetical protein DMB38_12765 [Streptomyces sp. WAC 06738]